jgi:C1A family cysteine protease
MELHCCGAMKSPEDRRDWIYEGLARGDPDDIPTEYSLAEYMGRPKAQGSRGTCAAFVGAGIKAINHRRSTGSELEFSAEFIYYNRQNRPVSGMFGRDLFNILRKYGVPPESKYPYESKRKPSSSVYNIAQNYRIAAYARVISADGLRRALYELGPCYLLLPLYSTRPRFWRPAEGEECTRGHAVLVIGYTHRGFIIVNSWGPKWNGDGTVVLPFEDWDPDWECWVAMDDEIELVDSSDRRFRTHRKCVIL